MWGTIAWGLTLDSATRYGSPSPDQHDKVILKHELAKYNLFKNVLMSVRMIGTDIFFLVGSLMQKDIANPVKSILEFHKHDSTQSIRNNKWSEISSLDIFLDISWISCQLTRPTYLMSSKWRSFWKAHPEMLLKGTGMKSNK